MTAESLRHLYRIMLNADRAFRLKRGSKEAALEARVAYLAARDHDRGQSLEEVSARSSLVATEYTDPRTVDLFKPERTAKDRDLFTPTEDPS